MTDYQITQSDYQFIRDHRVPVFGIAYRTAETTHSFYDEELWRGFDREKLLAGKQWSKSDQDYLYFATVSGRDFLNACNW